MALVPVDPLEDIKSEGTVFGAATPPRTIGDVLGDTGDLIPMYRGGVLLTEEDQPVVADTDDEPPVEGP